MFLQEDDSMSEESDSDDWNTKDEIEADSHCAQKLASTSAPVKI